MISELLTVIFEHPLLTTVFIVDIFLIALIIGFVSLRLFGETRPDKRILFILQKFKVKFKENEIHKIEDLYEMTINLYSKKGIISYKDGNGFLAREKILNALPEENHKTVKQIFEYYEQKKYGGKLENEPQIVSYFVHHIRNM